eukprot:TRINITY_DN8640_c0_g1_i1.p1 TRINITY_DN8640_c0_g1~~TRINITY_DN8640_c0_g1_i1.p1  ORF type:complete len:1171 (+),score=203.53 TRINITY_DN8640_c0_g1_i1:67-3579(+)
MEEQGNEIVHSDAGPVAPGCGEPEPETEGQQAERLEKQDAAGDFCAVARPQEVSDDGAESADGDAGEQGAAGEKAVRPSGSAGLRDLEEARPTRLLVQRTVLAPATLKDQSPITPVSPMSPANLSVPVPAGQAASSLSPAGTPNSRRPSMISIGTLQQLAEAQERAEQALQQYRPSVVLNLAQQQGESVEDDPVSPLSPPGSAKLRKRSSSVPLDGSDNGADDTPRSESKGMARTKSKDDLRSQSKGALVRKESKRSLSKGRSRKGSKESSNANGSQEAITPRGIRRPSFGQADAAAGVIASQLSNFQAEQVQEASHAKAMRRKNRLVRAGSDMSDVSSDDSESRRSEAPSQASVDQLLDKEKKNMKTKISSRAFENNRRAQEAEKRIMMSSRRLQHASKHLWWSSMSRQRKNTSRSVAPDSGFSAVAATAQTEEGKAGATASKDGKAPLEEFDDAGLRYLGLISPMKWVLTVLVACIISLQASGMILGSHMLGAWKIQVMQEAIHGGGGRFVGFIILLAYGLPCCSVASVLVAMIAPNAGGSGIPEIKAYLNGISMPNAFKFSTWLCRSVGLVLVTSAGLFAGTEGPFAHIGGMLASWCADGPSLFGINKCWPTVLTGHRNRCEFISQGCAMGVAAAFGAPVGGVLFSLEEASTYWSRSLTCRAFLGTLIAAVMAKLAKSGFTEVSTPGFVEFPDKNASFRVPELVYMAALALCTGLIGAAFCALVRRMMASRRSFFQLGAPTRTTKQMRIIEVIVITVVSLSVCYWVPYAFGCTPLPHAVDHERRLASTGDGPPDLSGSICPEGEYSVAGYILLQPKEAVIKALFSREMAHGAELDVKTLLWCFVIVFFTTILTFGSAIPVGLFIPNILAGACLGRAWGEVLKNDFGEDVHIGVYAMLGSAGCLAGFSRVTISLVVIFLEITNNVNLVLPLMLVIMVSKSIADRFGPSVYDLVLELNPEVHVLEDDLSEDHLLVLQSLTVHDVCTPDVIVLREYEPIQQIVTLLMQTSFSGYPVVADDDRLVGLVLRSSLVLLLEYRSVDSTELVDVLELAEDFPEIVSWSNPVARCFYHFRSSGLQHMCVVDSTGLLLGILTRTDFAKLCKGGAEGVEAVKHFITEKAMAVSNGQAVMGGFGGDAPNSRCEESVDIEEEDESDSSKSEAAFQSQSGG